VRKPFKIFSLIFFHPDRLRGPGRQLEVFSGLCGSGGAGRVSAQPPGPEPGLLVRQGFAGLPERDCRAVCIEVGIQNSALGLVLVFNFFDGLGGMAILVAWWGIWHIIAGLTTAFIFSRGDIPRC
jgi:BASS family bile acid:Na+ symporter